MTEVTSDNQGKPPEMEPAIVQIYTTSIEEFKRIVLYTSGNDVFKGTLANFC
jgi:hypothetical protein